MAKKYEPIGCAPELQGYLSRAYRSATEPPDWHRTHRLPEWRERWLRGYQERVEWENTPPIERGKK